MVEKEGVPVSMDKAVIAAVDDLFFAAKIRAAAPSGVDVRLCRALPAIIGAVRQMNAGLIIVDLHAKQFDPLILAETLRADDKLCDLTLLGFYSHVQTEVMQKAKAAGYDFVLPRSAFVNKLPEILEGKMERPQRKWNDE